MSSYVHEPVSNKEIFFEFYFFTFLAIRCSFNVVSFSFLVSKLNMR